MKYEQKIKAIEKAAAAMNTAPGYVIIYGREKQINAADYPGQRIVRLCEQDRDL